MDERLGGCFDAVQKLQCYRTNFKKAADQETDDLGLGELILVTQR